jgi:hypothetical protein
MTTRVTSTPTMGAGDVTGSETGALSTTDADGGVDPNTTGADAPTGEIREHGESEACACRGAASRTDIGALALLLLALGRQRRA